MQLIKMKNKTNAKKCIKGRIKITHLVTRLKNKKRSIIRILRK